MIRVVIYLVIVGLLAVGAVWLADRPGEVVITWQNRRIEMSVMVLIMAAVAIAIVTTLVWSAVRAILRAPDVLWLYLSKRRGVRGYMAVSQGLVAIGSGDARAARKHADEASRIAPDEPLTLLLTAQASQLSGDREAAERAFHVMAGRDDTRLLGLHGLFVEAQRRNDLVAARLYAEEAAQSARAPAWAGLAVFNARCAAGDFTGALEQLDRNSKSGLVDRAAYRRHRAVLLTARAMESEEHDRTGARSLVLEAVKNEPTLIPAAALAGRLLGEAGEMRRAARVVEAAWKANPHPDLAEAYAHLQPGDSARDRLKRIESLAKDAPGNIEGALAVARAALDAQEFAIARRALAPLSIAPTQRVAMLMAELEEKENGDIGRAREWMARAVLARRDPAWTADGIVSDHWMPVSPVSGRLDAFQWKDPIAEVDSDGGMIEHDKARTPAISMAPPAREPGVRSSDAREPDIRSPEVRPLAGQPLPPEPMPPPGRGLARASAAVVPIAPVIPLVHVPDDPGPDAQPPFEPGTETSPEPESEAWRKLKGLFK